MEEYKGTRKIKRCELDAGVKLKVHESSKGVLKLLDDEVSARTSDISDNGLGIYTPVYIPEGTHLKIALESGLICPEKKAPINIIVKVTSSIMAESEYRTGLEFIEISEEDRKAIIDYIQK